MPQVLLGMVFLRGVPSCGTAVLLRNSGRCCDAHPTGTSPCPDSSRDCREQGILSPPEGHLPLNPSSLYPQRDWVPPYFCGHSGHSKAGATSRDRNKGAICEGEKRASRSVQETGHMEKVAMWGQERGLCALRSPSGGLSAAGTPKQATQ